MPPNTLKICYEMLLQPAYFIKTLTQQKADRLNEAVSHYNVSGYFSHLCVSCQAVSLPDNAPNELAQAFELKQQ